MYDANNKYLPLTLEEAQARGWEELDIVLVTGDAYVDHPAFGTAVIGRILEAEGFRVGIIAMPDKRNPDSMTVFGKPKLFFGISSGNVDSMVAGYTAFKRPRTDDPYAPDGNSGHKPDRAVIVYANLIKKCYKDIPIVIGGIEASMRRFAHYDFWSNSVRRSILLDSRATILAYGMAEQAIVQIAHRIREEQSLENVPGTVLISTLKPEKGVELPAEENVLDSKNDFLIFYEKFYKNQHQILFQASANRYLIQYPQSNRFDSKVLDNIYDLPFVRKPHPVYHGDPIPAFEMIRHSINSHRGCIAGCSFCSLSLHQGKRIISRSKKSILREAGIIRKDEKFVGQITDVGGPSANMYGYDCKTGWKCKRESCLFPGICSNLKYGNGPWLDVMFRLMQMPRIDRVTIGSGIRYDLFMCDPNHHDHLNILMKRHVSGQLKIAPEHTSSTVLRAMRKSSLYPMKDFIKAMQRASKLACKRQFLVPYLMSCHPGSSKSNTEGMKREILTTFGFVPNQVQAFIPLPMTLSSVIYYTGKDPITGESFPVIRDMNKRKNWHSILLQKKENRAQNSDQRNDKLAVKKRSVDKVGKKGKRLKKLR